MENKSNSLAKISLGINLLLVVAVIVLFMKSPSGNNNLSDREPIDTNDVSMLGDKGEQSVVVYFNSDSLNLNSLFIVDLQAQIMQAQIDAERSMKAKEDDYMRWQRRWEEKQPLLSQEEQQYMQEAQQRQNDIMVFQQQLEQDLYAEQSKLTLTGLNRISMYARELALGNNYDFILQYAIGQNIVYCNPKMDVTNELVDLMNADYGVGESIEGDAAEEEGIN